MLFFLFYFKTVLRKTHVYGTWQECPWLIDCTDCTVSLRCTRFQQIKLETWCEMHLLQTPVFFWREKNWNNQLIYWLVNEYVNNLNDNFCNFSIQNTYLVVQWLHDVSICLFYIIVNEYLLVLDCWLEYRVLEDVTFSLGKLTIFWHFIDLN